MPGSRPGTRFTRDGWQGPAPALAVVAALLCSACEDGNSQPTPANPAPTIESATTVTSPVPTLAAMPASATERATRLRLQEPGTSTLRFEAGYLSVEANSAPRLPLLVNLAEAAEFAFQNNGGDLPPLTIQFEDLALDEALPLLLGDLSYQTEWVSDPQTRWHRLTSLVVGEQTAKTDSALRKDAESARDEVARIPYEEEVQVRAAVAEAIEQRSTSEWPSLGADELLRRAADSDPEVRLRAAIELEPEEEGLDRLIDLLANDPDPRVRAAATASLENSDSFGAVEALLAALRDPNPEVVVEVIDSLEFAGDASSIRHLEPLLAHEDSRVREAASEAIDFLED